MHTLRALEIIKDLKKHSLKLVLRYSWHIDDGVQDLLDRLDIANDRLKDEIFSELIAVYVDKVLTNVNRTNDTITEHIGKYRETLDKLKEINIENLYLFKEARDGKDNWASKRTNHIMHELLESNDVDGTFERFGKIPNMINSVNSDELINQLSVIKSLKLKDKISMLNSSVYDVKGDEVDNCEQINLLDINWPVLLNDITTALSIIEQFNSQTAFKETIERVIESDSLDQEGLTIAWMDIKITALDLMLDYIGEVLEISSEFHNQLVHG